MRDQQKLCCRLSRLVLLLAGLLYLFGAAADPIVHTYAADAPESALAAGGGDPDRDAPESEPPHDERHCLLCKVAGAVALSALAPAVPVLEARPLSDPQIRAGAPRAPPAALPSLPRAPPHA